VIPVACAAITLVTLLYVFYLPGKLHLGQKKTQAAYLRERKEAIYENLRDLNFEYKAGKFPEADYLALQDSLEAEAAGVLAEIARLEDSASSEEPRGRKGRRIAH
jgi:hypothetical protein